jgi:hypothetical protein
MGDRLGYGRSKITIEFPYVYTKGVFSAEKSVLMLTVLIQTEVIDG